MPPLQGRADPTSLMCEVPGTYVPEAGIVGPSGYMYVSSTFMHFESGHVEDFCNYNILYIVSSVTMTFYNIEL